MVPKVGKGVRPLERRRLIQMTGEGDYDNNRNELGAFQSVDELRQDLVIEANQKEKLRERIDIINYLSKEHDIRDPNDILADIEDVSEISDDESSYEYIDRLEPPEIDKMAKEEGYDQAIKEESPAGKDDSIESESNNGEHTDEHEYPALNDSRKTQEIGGKLNYIPVIGQALSVLLLISAGYFAIFANGTQYSQLASFLLPVFIFFTLIFVVSEHAKLSIGDQASQ